MLVVLTDAERQNGHEVGGGATMVSASVGSVISIRHARLVRGNELLQFFVLGKITGERASAFDRRRDIAFANLHVPEREARFGADEQVCVVASVSSTASWASASAPTGARSVAAS